MWTNKRFLEGNPVFWREGEIGGVTSKHFTTYSLGLICASILWADVTLAAKA
jgi:hypothetical protein